MSIVCKYLFEIKKKCFHVVRPQSNEDGEGVTA